MTQDHGASAEPTGLLSASQIEPLRVSPVPASIPSAVEVVAHADYIYDPENWECTYESVDAYEFEEHLDLPWSCLVRRVGCLKRVPDLYAVNIPDDVTEDGDPDGCTVMYFSSEQEAADAYASAIEARRAATGTGAVHESAVPQGDAQ